MFAAAMDLVVASDDAMFLPSLLQYFSIPWDVGVRKAKEILYQSRFVKAEEAEKLGFVNMVVPRAGSKQKPPRWRSASPRPIASRCGC